MANYKSKTEFGSVDWLLESKESKEKDGWESLENWKGKREKMSSIVKQKASEMNNTGKLKLISYVKFEQKYWNVKLKDSWRQ